MTRHPPALARRTRRDLSLGTLALVALFTAVVGLPVALYAATIAVIGVNDGSELFLGFLLVVGWYNWAAFTVGVVVEVVAQLRGRVAPRLPGAAGQQHLAASLVTTAAVLLLANPVQPSVRTHASTPTAPPPAAAIYPASYSSPSAGSPPDIARSAPPADHVAHRQHETTGHLRRHLVQRGDTLWSIAQHQLGDGERWRQIALLNYDRPQPDGHALTDAHWIRPGWELLLPDDSAPSTSPAHTRQPARHPAHVTPLRPPDAPRVDQSPKLDGAQPEPNDPSPPRPDPPTAPVIRLPDPRPARPATDHHPAIVLPDGGLVAAGFAGGISAALLTSRLQRRRRRLPTRPAPGLLTRDPLLTPTVTALHRAHTRTDQPPAPTRITIEPGDTTPTTDAPNNGGRPLRIPVAIDSDGRALDINVDDHLGVGLSGLGAAATARALVAHLLTTTTNRVRLLTTDTAARIVPGVRDLPHATVVADTDALAHTIHREVIARTRLLDSYDTPSLDRLLDEHADETEPYLLLLTEPPAADTRTQWATLLGHGHTVGLGALILGQWPAGTTIVIDEVGQITDTTGSDALANLVGARAVTMSAAACLDTLPLVAHATGATAPADLAPATHPGDRDVPAPVAPAPTSTAPTPARLHLFGPMRVTVGDRELDTGLRSKSRELLAFLALHPRGVTEDQTIDALWPDADLDRGHTQFRTALANLRKVLRDASDRPDSKIVEHHTGRYQLDPTVLDIDIWDFQHALTDATAPDASLDEQHAALTRAADLYDGDLLDRAAYLWAEAPREDLRRRAVDTLVRLADTHAGRPDDGDRAIGYYERAIDIEPYQEDLYRRLMKVHAQLGRADAVHRTYRTLEARLAELDADPDPATEQLLVQLTRTDPPPGPAPATDATEPSRGRTRSLSDHDRPAVEA